MQYAFKQISPRPDGQRSNSYSDAATDERCGAIRQKPDRAERPRRADAERAKEGRCEGRKPFGYYEGEEAVQVIKGKSKGS